MSAFQSLSRQFAHDVGLPCFCTACRLDALPTEDESAAAVELDAMTTTVRCSDCSRPMRALASIAHVPHLCGGCVTRRAVQ